MFDDIKKLIAEARAGQIGDVLITAGGFSIKLGELYNSFIGGEKMAVDGGAEDAAIAELEACCGELKKAPKAAADPKSMDPATILLLVTTVLNALKAFREWRKKRQEG